jgi:hypothetical protein
MHAFLGPKVHARCQHIDVKIVDARVKSDDTGNSKG